MAEQSIGMPTTGTGDGTTNGYANTRMVDMLLKTIGGGVLMNADGTLGLALTGQGTTTLNIGVGNAIVGGYFYQNTTALTISTSTIADGSYFVYVAYNAGAGNVNIIRNAAGTTVLSPRTVRTVIATSGQIAVLERIQLASITIVSGTITVLTPTYSSVLAQAPQLPYQAYATMSGGTATLTNANTNYDITGYSSPSTTSDAIFSTNTTTGEITVRRAGLYTVNANAIFSSGTTGNRVLGIQVNGTFIQSTRAASSGTATHAMTQTVSLVLAAGDVVKATVITTLAAQSIASGILTISWA